MFEFVSGRTAGEVVPQRSQGAIVILRVEEPFPGLEPAREFILLISKHAFPARREIKLPRGDVPVPDAIIGAGDDQGKAFLLAAEREFGAFAFGDIGNQTVVAGNTAPPVAARHRRVAHPADAVGAMVDAVFQRRDGFSPEESGDVPDCGRPIRGFDDSVPKVSIGMEGVGRITSDHFTAGANMGGLDPIIPKGHGIGEIGNKGQKALAAPAVSSRRRGRFGPSIFGS